jgi:hypothetical protein
MAQKAIIVGAATWILKSPAEMWAYLYGCSALGSCKSRHILIFSFHFSFHFANTLALWAQITEIFRGLQREFALCTHVNCNPRGTYYRQINWIPFVKSSACICALFVSLANEFYQSWLAREKCTWRRRSLCSRQHIWLWQMYILDDFLHASFVALVFSLIL